MQVQAILNQKGSEVVCVSETATVEQAAQKMNEHSIGAVVVCKEDETCDDWDQIVGVLSERDIVKAVAKRGQDVLEELAWELMSLPVLKTSPDANVEDLAQTMLDEKVRHLVVVDNNKMVGIVSIGDVVKRGMTYLATLTQQLEEYVRGGR